MTTLTPEYPLIRFATGDLSAMLPRPDHDQVARRTNHRIKGWLGRADQTTKVRGLFVHPEQIAEVLRRHTSIIRARLVVERPTGADEMTLLVELGEPADDLGPHRRDGAGADPVARERSARCRAAACREDGKLIEDRRPHRLKFTKTSHFLQTEVSIRAPYGRCKVYPYRFVPQTSYSAEVSADGQAAPDSPSGAAFLLNVARAASSDPAGSDCAHSAAPDSITADLVAEDLACRRGERLVFAGVSFRLSAPAAR